jgi:hypothetical protein
MGIMKWLSIILCAGLILFAVSCDDHGVDCTSCKCNPALCPHPPAVQDLSHKTDVLNNIEYAYNKRQTNVYDALLDDAFTFFYTDSDVVGGGTPVQWGRPDELATTSGVLSAASSIDLALDWRDGVTWSEQEAGIETWYFTTVFYHFTIKIGDTTYIPNAGAKAQFTVRNAGTAEQPHWKLVEFRDLGGPS